ncbi:MAG: site-specific DNA-methyltransferase [Anaerolineaceae bacterium]
MTLLQEPIPFEHQAIHPSFEQNENIAIYSGDAVDFLKTIPNETFQLIITSPPYNIGKEYERKVKLEDYIEQQAIIIKECVRTLNDTGSICWQTGNFVENGSIIPLDIVIYPIFEKLGLKLRNRIIWHFEHGLHSSRRLSGRYETILWFTKTENYVFNLDPIRVPQKYPNKKHFKGPNIGKLSGNPLGKNPGDVWNIPNVKNNHVEKLDHPCQFPVELIERFVLSLTDEGDWVFDPFLGTGTTVVAAIKNHRKGAGSEILQKYVDISLGRVQQEIAGVLRTRPMDKPIYIPPS